MSKAAVVERRMRDGRLHRVALDHVSSLHQQVVGGVEMSLDNGRQLSVEGDQAQSLRDALAPAADDWSRSPSAKSFIGVAAARAGAAGAIPGAASSDAGRWPRA
jgi:hypothetical protein